MNSTIVMSSGPVARSRTRGSVSVGKNVRSAVRGRAAAPLVPPPWLLLVHQIPPKPDAFRARVSRRLQRLGAVAIKNSVYVLPNREESREDAQWLCGEIAEAGGEALVCEAAFVEGLSDDDVKALFRAARASDWLEIAAQARALGGEFAGERLRSGEDRRDTAAEARARAGRELARLVRRAAAVEALDYFGAPEREEATMAIEEARQALRRLAAGATDSAAAGRSSPLGKGERPQGRSWTTRRNPRVDRMSSAWLIRRFVDPEARFRFVDPATHRHRRGELRFDMAQAEFGHEGDRCTFETLVGRFVPRDPALRQIAEIVHDVDLKDGKFGREEAAGVARLVDGIAATAADDPERLERGAAVFEALYAAFGGGPMSSASRSGTRGRPR